MGQLKPGATYIYEKADGVTYAREFGSTDRVVVGMDYNGDSRVVDRLFGIPVAELAPWAGLLRMAQDNPELKEELDRLVTFYHMAKQDKDKFTMWHPV